MKKKIEVDVDPISRKRFKTDDELVKWANDNGIDFIIAIVKDHTNGDWVLFYVVEE